MSPFRRKGRRPRRPEVRCLSPEANARASLNRSLILVALVTLAGTMGFVEIEGWDAWRSFYFTLITITTVGYGDEGLSDAGKKFTTILLVGGVLAASYTFATIVQTSIASQLATGKRMRKEIKRLRNHTIICGFGRLGRSVCEKLAKSDHPFVVIERDPNHARNAMECGYLVIEGTASEGDSLASAGLEDAGYVVAAVDSFAQNLVIAMEARDVNPRAVVIARAEREEDKIKLERVGVSRVLCLFESGGRETVDLITRPAVAQFLAQAAIGEGKIGLAQVRVHEGSELVGVKLADFGRDHVDQVSFVSLASEGEQACVPPRGDVVLAAGDHLIVAGDLEQIAHMERLSLGYRSAA